MFDDPDRDATEFSDELEENTVFDPNPFGARQRVPPKKTFLAKVRTIVPAMLPAKTAQRLAALPSRVAAAVVRKLPPPIPARALAPATLTPAPRPFHPSWSLIAARPPVRPHPSHRWPKARTQATIKRFAAPICGAIAVIALVIAYVAKPSTGPRPRLQIAASVAPKGSVVVTPIAQPEPIEQPAFEPTVPDVAPKADPRKTTRAKAKRRPIKIDKLDTASPLGRLRPNKSR